MPHLYLVDGSGYIFRAYHRLPPLTNKHGEPVGAVYGYTTMLWKLADELHKADGPTHMAVILDKSSHTFRNEMYDQVQGAAPARARGSGPAIPDDPRRHPRLLAALHRGGLGWEADDLIASYAKAALGAGLAGHHRQLGQGSDAADRSRVDMYDTMNNRRLGRKPWSRSSASSPASWAKCSR
jgi:DNA polymerase-1